jgi:asparagine synthase (glutamine-hydrolysing)
LLRRLYPYLVNLRGQPQPYLEAFFRAGLEDPTNPFFSHLPRWRMTARIKQLFSDDLRVQVADYNAIDEFRSLLPADFGTWHPLSQVQYLEAGYLLPGYILSSQGDRMSMAHAVEGRFPFLDHRLVEFANSLPPRLKLKGLVEKHILRKCMRRHLPEVIAQRPKQPYRAPDAESFFGPFAPDYVPDILSDSSVRQTGLFDAAAVSRLVEKCRAGGAIGFRDNMALVGVLSVQLLHDGLMSGKAQRVPSEASLAV